MTNEPNNFHRAGWARNALALFVRETCNGTALHRLGDQGLSDAIADLVCDLLHFANQSGLHPEQVIAQAQANYAAEMAEVQP